jgi:hypothetical protein
MWQFPSIFSEALHFCLHLSLVKGAVEILIMLCSSSPIFALSNHTAFSQTQTGATVPLNAAESVSGLLFSRMKRGCLLYILCLQEPIQLPQSARPPGCGSRHKQLPTTL